ncbi:class I SAM-dependent methyltransferase [Cereibacter sphaeroides]|uniref:class I SAM-dependent methyltransferase n=1 Tax=Cereibacter sphaeroides TaxID=1063 RepID=UPI001F22266B|nr:class I SAM-dependent methyltransferase [Cereibacter sphaeroides]MCE6957693.1 class I SAM-dependent methyltransferase [Cereibacter sphaeroides]MCE6967166.1 class I SAM-dependent methyltransferase [Cereibacter sphaeroides]MCE6971458.1 class I SAM-dependent methyltransferase [Cereibacter sphaeroides]
MTALPHAALMDATYRHQRRIYDVTRRYFLLGRDELIAALDPPPGARVLEIACGTGRNLDLIGRRWPGVRLHGLDISEEMLRTARGRLGGRARLVQGDATCFDPQALFGTDRFERIVISYALSMIPDWRMALGHAASHLAEGGEVHVVDFGDQAGLPRWFRAGLRGWIGRFHVEPRDDLDAALGQAAAGIGGTHRSEALFRDYARRGMIRRATNPRPQG